MSERNRRLALLGAAGLMIGVGQAAAQRERARPVPGQAPGAVTVGAVNGRTLYLRAGAVDTSAPKAGLGALAGAAGQFVVQLDGPITPQRRARMTAAGMEIGDYLPMYAYIVRLDGADAEGLAGLEFIRWHSPYRAEWKVDPDVGRVPASTPEGVLVRRAGRVPVLVTLFSTLSGAEEGAARRAVWDVPGVVTYWEEQVGGCVTMSLEIAPQDVAALAGIPGVQYIEQSPEVSTRNLTTRWIVQSNVQGEFPLYDAGLHGEGQIVGILDTGVDQNHCSFKDTAPIGPTHRKIVGYHEPASAQFHGTHVAGIVVGDAGSETNTRGMAYLGKLTYGDIPNFTEQAVVTALNLSHADGARVHTNSWGDDGTTAYNSLCRGFDAFNWDHEDDLVCLAVTNQSLLKNPENAKNLLAVGNSNDTPTQGNICTGGAGPTSDGRRKPEVFAPGCDTQSSASGTACGTTGATGTSMATPATAGVGMLIRQYYMDGFYPGGVANPSNGFTPTAALLKATLINSAVDMNAAGYPSNAEGWGRILADNAMHFFGETRNMLLSDVRHAGGLTTGSEVTLPVNVLGPGEQLRITVVWTEPPATAGASFAAINDLDLEVEGPGGIYKGNVFSGGVSVPGGSRDDRNNVEQVHLTSPIPGAYTVRVKGANVAVGAQGFAVLVTGDIEGGDPPPIVIRLPSGYPQLVAPGVPTDIDVEVLAGAQNVVPGSEKIFFRTDTGAFTEMALTSLGGNQYRATVPALECTDEPQFYFQASGDGGAVVTMPQNAPVNTLSMEVGVLATTTEYTQTFEGALPPGWTATGLWSLTDLCGTGPACEGSRWAYYGNVATCSFLTGTSANSGSLTSAPISLPAVPPGGVITLKYCSALETENLAGWDDAIVRVNGTQVDQAAESAAWEQRSCDLTAFAGQSVNIEFNFDTGDGVNNDHRGWQVDNLRIEVTSLECADCYPDCNTDGMLNLADFGCFQTRFALGDMYADCNGDGVLNLADFGCFQTEFGLGCP